MAGAAQLSWQDRRPSGPQQSSTVETTGFSLRNDEIIELAIALFRYDRVAGHVLDIAGEYSGPVAPFLL